MGLSDLVKDLLRRYMLIGSYWRLFTYLVTIIFSIILVKVAKRFRFSTKRTIALILLFFYLLTVYMSTVIDRNKIYISALSSQPFLSWKKAFYGNRHHIQMIIENIIMIMPIGLVIPLINRTKNTFWKTIIIGFGFSLFIETSQYILRRGIFEVDDIINNTIGVIIGCIVSAFYLKIETSLKNIIKRK